MMEYIGAFVFPASERAAVALLSDAHWESCKKAEMFKCSASDGLTLYAILAKFFEDVLLPRHTGSAGHAALASKIASYKRLCDVIDLLYLSKVGRDVLPEVLDDVVLQWRDAHAVAYGKSLTYLKTHLTSHLADMLRLRRAKKKQALMIARWTLDRPYVFDACACII